MFRQLFTEVIYSLRKRLYSDVILYNTYFFKDLQKLLELSQRTDDTTLASPMDKLDSKVMKNKAEIQVLKVRIDEIETKSKKEKEDEKSKDVIVVEQLPNDQNALDTLKSRLNSNNNILKIWSANRSFETSLTRSLCVSVATSY